MWSSSYSDNEEKETIDTDDPDISESDILEILSSLVRILCQKRQLHITTDFVITHIRKYAINYSDIDHRKQVNNVIKQLFHGLSGEEIDFTIYIFWT